VPGNLRCLKPGLRKPQAPPNLTIMFPGTRDRLCLRLIDAEGFLAWPKNGHPIVRRRCSQGRNVP
jgi:hypothetical protein